MNVNIEEENFLTKDDHTGRKNSPFLLIPWSMEGMTDMVWFGLMLVAGMACGFVLSIPVGHLAVWLNRRANELVDQSRQEVIDSLMDRPRNTQVKAE